jgi:predicted dehydrogenase
MKPVGIGIVGCGKISDAYFGNLKKFDGVATAFCADLDARRAQGKAAQWDVPRHGTVDELLADPAVELVVNLTIPQAHADVDLRALRAGKHVYSEKPFATTLAEADQVIALARERKLLVGCAPDTQLHADVQTARAAIDAGLIGRPIAAQASVMMGGHECWHPDPEFYYLAGGGPMLDLGVYHVAALTTLLGPVARVAGMATRTWNTRTITSQPKAGTVIPVEVDTHIACLLAFANGATGTLVTSFDIRTAYTAPSIEILGETGSIALPCGASQQVRISGLEDKGGWRELPFSHPYAKDARGLGVADMAMAIRSGRPHRNTGEFARHTLAIMLHAHRSGREGRWLDVPPCARPAAMEVRPDYQLES